MSRSRSGLPSNWSLPRTSKTWPPERLARLLQLLQELPVDVALARLLGHEVPEVADLRLADAVDAPEPLLEPVRVPGQVVVHHEVRALEVDALPCGVGREQDLDLRVVLELLLRLQALLAPQSRRG